MINKKDCSSAQKQWVYYTIYHIYTVTTSCKSLTKFYFLGGQC